MGDLQALIEKNLGDLDAASGLYSEAVDVYTLVYGEGHPSTALAIHNTAALWHRCPPGPQINIPPGCFV